MRKKRFAGVLFFVILIPFSACGPTEGLERSVLSTATVSQNANHSSSTTTQKQQETSLADITFPDYLENPVEIEPVENYEYAGFERKYRDIYYRYDGTSAIEDRDAYEKWFQERLDSIGPSGPEEMGIVAKIKHFNIPKEVFVENCKILLAQYLAEGKDIYSEQFEVPNPDIIYTFDNEIINDYYRRDR